MGFQGVSLSFPCRPLRCSPSSPVPCLKLSNWILSSPHLQLFWKRHRPESSPGGGGSGSVVRPFHHLSLPAGGMCVFSWDQTTLSLSPGALLPPLPVPFTLACHHFPAHAPGTESNSVSVPDPPLEHHVGSFNSKRKFFHPWPVLFFQRATRTRWGEGVQQGCSPLLSPPSRPAQQHQRTVHKTKGRPICPGIHN